MIFIRHGEKEYKNGKCNLYPLDPDLTQEGKLMAYSKFSLLLATYGVPDKIIASPYLRTRTTADVARNLINDITGIQVEVIYDNYLSEFLKYDKYNNTDMEMALRPETLQFNPMLPETHAEHKERMQDVLDTCIPNVWYITHGYNITTKAVAMGYKISYPQELCGIFIDDDHTITII